MPLAPTPTPVRERREWALHTDHPYGDAPMVEVRVTATFTAPSGNTSAIEGFWDGEGTWRVRFNPGESGEWTYRIASVPPNPDLTREGAFTVTDAETALQRRGFLRSTPDAAWGFRYEDGEPAFIFGDTVYHLFAMAHMGDDAFAQVLAFLERRAAQGFTLLRIRVPVSRFHHPDGVSEWQTKPVWPWGGSEQMPRFDQVNLAYFRTVDAVMAQCEDLGIGVELILEAWGNEFPFNSRQIFTAEWEELWVRYLIARYDAFRSLSMWQLQNEYEYYPNGDWNYPGSTRICDRWAIRIGHLVRDLAPHGHIVAIHNGPVMPPFGERFRSDPTVIDTVMFQTWGTTGEADAWLAAGIEEVISASLGDWPGSAVLAEWGYEFAEDLPPIMLGHRWCGPDHTRRGAWRGVFSGLGIVHGFHYSWGPFMVLDRDQPGMADLLQVRALVERLGLVRDSMRPAPDLIASEETRPGYMPRALASAGRDRIAIYLPAGGSVTVPAEVFPSNARWQWVDPRTGETSLALPSGKRTFIAPTGDDDPNHVYIHPADWLLVLA